VLNTLRDTVWFDLLLPHYGRRLDKEFQAQQAGGTFKPVIYNWMLHVWPLETDPSKVWATEEHPGSMDH